MKLLHLVPIIADVISPEIDTYVRKYLSADTILITDQITVGPVTIECAYDEALAQPDIIAHCIQAEKDGFDGVFISCFADPGVRAARECVDIPVFGGFEPAIHIALGLTDKIGIVTTLKNVVSQFYCEIAKAHLGDRVPIIRNMNIPVLEIMNHSKLCDSLVEECVKAIELDGVGGIVLGCTGMIDVAETISTKLLEAGYDIPIIEPAQAAVMMLELYVKMGLKHSRVTYMPIRKK